MNIQIDTSRRYACMRAHTATHLLHAQLGKIFPQTKQAGSYVGPDELRFDFFAERGLTVEELTTIAQSINTSIAENNIVTVTEMPYEQALQTGAKAFFEDTYPEIVRVVKIVAQDHSSKVAEQEEILSVELCGGTHVRETGQIGSFVITEQGAVAAGIKRISALTGPKVAEYVGQLQSQIDTLAQKVGVSAKQLEAKIDKILLEDEEMKETIEQLSIGIIKTIIWKPSVFGTVTLDSRWSYEKDIAMLGLSFNDTVMKIKGNAEDRSWMLISQTGQYALAHPQAKQLCKELGLKGGGSDTFVQGRDEKVLSL